MPADNLRQADLPKGATPIPADAPAAVPADEPAATRAACWAIAVCWAMAEGNFGNAFDGTTTYSWTLAAGAVDLDGTLDRLALGARTDVSKPLHQLAEEVAPGDIEQALERQHADVTREGELEDVAIVHAMGDSTKVVEYKMARALFLWTEKAGEERGELFIEQPRPAHGLSHSPPSGGSTGTDWSSSQTICPSDEIIRYSRRSASPFSL